MSEYKGNSGGHVKRYYQDEQVEIWNGDARDLSTIPDACAGLVLTSPPWWDSGDYGHENQIGFGQTYEDYLTSLVLAWKACYRCLMPGRAIILWMADILWREEPVPLVADTHTTLQDAGFLYESTFYWHTPQSDPLPDPERCMPMTARPKHQPGIMILYRKPGVSTPLSPDIMEASRIDSHEYRDSLQAVWTPGPYMDDPYGRLIRLWSFVGDTVLDPFAGQGSVPVFAKRLGRKGIAVELSASICVHTAGLVRDTQAPEWTGGA